MSGDKVKVFTLAKRYGFKSSEFVKILGDIGFPVRSYQASVEDWDVPVIEERLLRGGLIQASQATTLQEEAEAAEEEATSDAPSWQQLMDSAAKAEAEAEAVAEPQVEAVAETPVESTPAAETAPAEQAPAEAIDSEPETLPAEAEAEVADTPLSPQAEAAEAESPAEAEADAEPEPAETPEPRVEAAPPVEEEAAAPVEVTSPTPTESDSDLTEDSTPAPEAAETEPSPSPTPEPVAQETIPEPAAPSPTPEPDLASETSTTQPAPAEAAVAPKRKKPPTPTPSKKRSKAEPAKILFAQNNLRRSDRAGQDSEDLPRSERKAAPQAGAPQAKAGSPQKRREKDRQAPQAKAGAPGSGPAAKGAGAKAVPEAGRPAGKKEGGKGKKAKGKDGSKTPPKPKPRQGAKKVGMIDLEALGLVKAKQAKDRRNVTFTDVRDRENARRRNQRTRQRERLKQRRSGQLGPAKVSTIDRKSEVVLDAPVTVKSFSLATGVAVNQILGKLMRMGTMANVNAALDEDTVEVLADDLGIPVRLKQSEDVEESLMEEIQEARQALDDSTIEPRPPVIAFLGHVDHGKTTLIDAIRNTKVAQGEAGGITQHIAASMVTMDDGRRVAIIDTPGHEAFTAMRARGAHTTDLVVLVVAADDGVMPQTEEAANHAKAAGVPIVVAINKVDAPGANADKVRAELAGIGIQSEEWGGEIGMIEVSALRRTGIQELLERVLLEAEVLELAAHARGDAMGTVLESQISEGRGKVADVLVQDGTLKTGDVVLAGHSYGKIRRMYDHRSKVVKKAGPSTPVVLLGLNEMPPAGERFYVVRNMAAAKEVAEKRVQHLHEAERAEKSKIGLANIFDRMEEDSLARINVVLKVDVQGSLEVLRDTLPGLSNDEVRVSLVHSGVGGITESDVQLAETTEAIVIGFNVGPDSKAKRYAEKNGVEVRKYNVIYEMTEDLQLAIQGMLRPDIVEENRGKLDVLQVFRSSRFGTIAGCAVSEGEVSRAYSIRIVRNGRVVHDGEIESLRHLKDDVRQVKAGSECGVRVAGYDSVQVGDVLEAYEKVEKSRSLEESELAEQES
ncbi:MAG: translation initiation factor IF-2 [Planctomycetota bacterium]|nr:MAG: translation initiation factor IF-2 [Planctomycetota bacterium]